jgi:hypothetical protein
MLFVVVLMLLDLQLESVPASFVTIATIALLVAVLWQSFRTTPVESPKNG